MADRQVRVDLTVEDKASKTIADVAADVAALEKESPKIAVTVDDRDTKADLDALITKLDGLDGDTATIVLALKAADVQKELQNTLLDVARLDTSDPLIDVKLAHAEDLRADLDTIETKVRDINGLTVDIDASPMHASLDDAGKHVAGFKESSVNAATDLTGVLGGELSQSIGGVGQAFTGAAELAGGMGIAVEGVMGPIALAGIAIGGLKFLWDANKKKTEEATQAAKDWADAIKAANGNLDEAANKKLADILTPAQIQTALDYKLSLQDLVKVANGQAVPAWDNMRGSIKEYDRQADLVRRSASPLNEEQFAALQDNRDKVDDLTTAIKNTGQAMHDGAVDAENYRQFTADAVTATERLKQRVDDAKQAIDDLGLSEGKKIEMKLAIDRGELDDTENRIEILRRNNKINMEIIFKSGAGYGAIVGPQAGPRAVNPAPAPMVVNVNMPAGSRGVDVVRQIAGQARRSGRRYGGAAVVHYANR